MTPGAGGSATKLCVFLADLGDGGAERMSVAIANGMAARGMAVSVVVASKEGPFVDEVAPDVKLVDLGTGSVSRALLPLARYLRSERPDVMLTTLAHTSFVAVAAKVVSATGVPTVVREASTPQRVPAAHRDARSQWAHRLARLTYRFADGAIAVSEGVADALTEVLGVPRSKVVTLYNPVVTADVRELAEAAPEHPWFGPDGPPVVLNVGGLRPDKDHATLLRAFARLGRPDVRLVVLGEGPERHRLESLIDALGLQGRVDLPGFDRNPFSYMARAAVYASASRREGLPGALIQAMAVGCPVVAADCRSGPREVLQDGRLGPLVPVGDEAALADGIAAMLDDPPPAATLIASAERYDASRVLDATHDYLVQAASRRRRGPPR